MRQVLLQVAFIAIGVSSGFGQTTATIPVLDSRTLVGLRNPSDTTATVSLTAYTPEGRLLTSPGTANPAVVHLEPHTATTLEAGKLFALDKDTTISGWVEISSMDQQVWGIFSFRDEKEDYFANAPESSGKWLVLIPAGAPDTLLFAVNTDSVPWETRIRVRSESGSVLQDFSRWLPGKARLEEKLELPAGLGAQVEILSAGPVVGGAMQKTATGAMVLPAALLLRPAEALSSPALLPEDGPVTLRLASFSDDEQSVLLILRNKSGLAPGRQNPRVIRLAPHALLEADLAGLVGSNAGGECWVEIHNTGAGVVSAAGFLTANENIFALKPIEDASHDRVRLGFSNIDGDSTDKGTRAVLPPEDLMYPHLKDGKYLSGHFKGEPQYKGKCETTPADQRKYKIRGTFKNITNPETGIKNLTLMNTFYYDEAVVKVLPDETFYKGNKVNNPVVLSALLPPGESTGVLEIGLQILQCQKFIFLADVLGHLQYKPDASFTMTAGTSTAKSGGILEVFIPSSDPNKRVNVHFESTGTPSKLKPGTAIRSWYFTGFVFERSFDRQFGAGIHTIKHTVGDDDGQPGVGSEEVTGTVWIQVNQVPTALFTMTKGNIKKKQAEVLEVQKGDLVTLTSQSTDKDGRIIKTSWDVYPEQPPPPDVAVTRVDGREATTTQLRFGPNDVGYQFRVGLTVTDDRGFWSYTSAAIRVLTPKQ